MLSNLGRKWRDRCPKEYESVLSEGLSGKFYIVQEKGPLKFILKDEQGVIYQVLLGGLHQCTCQHKLGPSLCTHIVWSLHRKLHIPSSSPLLYQTGLLERELDQLSLTSHKIHASSRAEKEALLMPAHSHPKQRPITESDVCPVCQDLFIDSDQPACSCQVCGNNVHVPCIKLVAEHQLKALIQSRVTCPFCRSEFQSVQKIEQAYHSFTMQRRQLNKRSKECFHPGVYCCQCTKPVRGRCYQCIECHPIRHLCLSCFQDGHHCAHAFKYQDTPHAPWILATRYVPKSMPASLIQSLETRELGDSDYQTLLELDQSMEQQGHERLIVVNHFPIYRLHRTGSSPLHCLICLDVFAFGEAVRKLPCGHAQFHQQCIDRWLLQSSTKCPACSHAVILQLDSGKFLPSSSPPTPSPSTPTDLILALCTKKTVKPRKLPPPIPLPVPRSPFFRKKPPLPAIRMNPSASSSTSFQLHITGNALHPTLPH